MRITTKEITIPISPKPQSRPRSTVVKGRIKVYEDKEAKIYKEAIKIVCKNRIKEKIQKPNPVSLHIIFYLKNISTKKPDVDNLSKAILDALNGLLFDDDAQVIYLVSEKIQSDSESVVIKILEEKTKKEIIDLGIKKYNSIYDLAEIIGCSWRTLFRYKNDELGEKSNALIEAKLKKLFS